MVDFDSREVHARQVVLAKDSHVQAQVKKFVEVLRNVQGVNHMDSEEVLQHVALGIAILEADPECQQTANFGGVTVARGPKEGYSLHVLVTDVFVTRLDKYEPERWHQWRPGKLIAKDKA